MINTFVYAKKLEEVGVSREQAETHVQMLTEIVEDSLVTKQELRHEIQQLEYRLIIKMGAMNAALATIIIASLALILKS